MSDLETAQTLMRHVADKKIDDAVALMAEDVTMNTPMGKQKGRTAIGTMLKMVVGMGAAPSEPAEEAGEIVSRAVSPMGPVKIVFVFRDGLVCEIQNRFGAAAA